MEGLETKKQISRMLGRLISSYGGTSKPPRQRRRLNTTDFMESRPSDTKEAVGEHCAELIPRTSHVLILILSSMSKSTTDFPMESCFHIYIWESLHGDDRTRLFESV